MADRSDAITVRYDPLTGPPRKMVFEPTDEGWVRIERVRAGDQWDYIGSEPVDDVAIEGADAALEETEGEREYLVGPATDIGSLMDDLLDTNATVTRRVGRETLVIIAAPSDVAQIRDLDSVGRVERNASDVQEL